MKGLHLAICIPGGEMPMESVRSFGLMLMNLQSGPIELANGQFFTHISLHFASSSILPYVRACVIDEGLRGGATHFLLLDSDMTYPPHVARTLLAHRRPFVACNATTRRPPIRWCAKRMDGEIMDSNEGKGLERAKYVGLAVCLVERRVLTGTKPPRFPITWEEKDDGSGESGWVGEDVNFCRKARESGFQPMVDHDLSREIGHVGARVHGGWNLDAGEPDAVG